jgi:hypothetical protein
VTDIKNFISSTSVSFLLNLTNSANFHRSEDTYFGLSPIDVRKLAFNVAREKNLQIHLSWTKKLSA